MLKFIIPSFIFVFFVTYFYIGEDFQSAEYFQQNWIWNKTEHYGSQEDSRFDFKPQSVINAYKTKEGIFLFGINKVVPIPEDKLLEIPLNGDGYLLYEKVGDAISYYSEAAEILWEKPYQSYPRASFTGKFILYISGDQNRVLFSDINGNPIGEKEVNGRFLVDYSFSIKSDEAILVFAGGEVYKVNSKGEVVYKTVEKNTTATFFQKSSCISPNGKTTAIHYTKKGIDFVKILDEEGARLATVKLKKVYPHKLFMSISDDGYLLINTPDDIFLYDKGEIITEFNKSLTEGIYQVAFHFNSYFIASYKNMVVFFNKAGNVIKKKELYSMPFRIIPSGNHNVMFLETPDEIISFQLIQ